MYEKWKYTKKTAGYYIKECEKKELKKLKDIVVNKEKIDENNTFKTLRKEVLSKLEKREIQPDKVKANKKEYARKIMDSARIDINTGKKLISKTEDDIKEYNDLEEGLSL